ncbi:hypothetical protein ACFY0P_45210 [Streptomyces sp. NPDC001714]|uniref:hypothetical protein n=1 Tax=Streptomyces sp. NPDC001714 TaxID=3364603 RepID=UPI0036B9D07A
MGVLALHTLLPGLAGLPPPPRPESIRRAKEWLSRRMPPGATHQETAHQPSFAVQFDLDAARAAAPSFDKLCRHVRFLVTGERERHD